MKNILLLVHDDAGQPARVQAALDLCRGLDGHITCVDVAWVPPLASNGFYDHAYAVADIATQETTREAVNRTNLEERLAHEGVSWEWIAASGDIGPCLRESADLADLIVINRAIDEFGVPDMRRAAGELVVQSGKPVLAVPAESKGLDLASALIAWDGSPAAAAALRAAVPLLQRGVRATILEIEDGSVAAPAEDAVSYLSRNDVDSVIRRAHSSRHGAGHVLLDEAFAGTHGYVVMGGFGHLRWVEALFGGVTRTMLTHSPVPVFLAH